MSIMNSSRLKTASLLLTLSILNGCADLGRTYSQIDPEGAREDIRKHNGYYDLKSVTPGTAKLVMTNVGDRVKFEISTSGTDCQDFRKVGDTSDFGRGIIYPWIADFSEARSSATGFLSTELVPGQAVYIQAYGSSFSFSSVNGVTNTSSSSCGPLISKFIPEANHAYRVVFFRKRTGCIQEISDATNPDTSIPVPVEQIAKCTNP